MVEEKLIFIISLPRSGSTYLQALLSNNNFVNTCSEPWILLNYLNQIKPSLVNTEVNNPLAVEAFNNYKKKFSKVNFNKIQREHLLSIYSPMLLDFKYVLDKTPRYWEIMEEIRSLFPNSKIIVIKRNPFHVVESIFRTWKVDNLEKLLQYKRDLLFGPFEIKSYEEKYIDCPLSYFLSYEELIGNSESEVKKLYQWLEIPFNSEVLKIEKNKKFQGKYGDPFLNSEKGYDTTKKKSDLINLNNFQRKFLLGYNNFLGTEFLKSYGYYQEIHQGKKTAVFSHFLLKSNFSRFQNFNQKLNYLVKDQWYSILSKIL